MEETPQTSPREFEVGLYSFVELTPDPRTGTTISPEQRMKNLLEEVELADQVLARALDFYQVPRDDMSVLIVKRTG